MTSSLELCVVLLLVLAIAADDIDGLDEGKDEITRLDQSDRWRQSVAVRLTTQGPDKPFDVHRTRRDSSVTATFKRAISNVLDASKKCTPSKSKRCTLAHNSPGLVGELYYNFSDSSRNIQGHSTQVLIACRCIDRGCREAIVLEPRRVFPSSKYDDFVCLYPRVRGKWRDCHTELLRLQEIDVHDVHQFDVVEDFLVDFGGNDFWRANGKRKHVQNITTTELNLIKKINFRDIIADYRQRAMNNSKDDFYVFGNDSVGDTQSEDEQFVEDGDGEECAKLFNYAHRSADWMGAQQDQLAIGMNEKTFLVARPEEPSSSDAFLAIGAGFTGLFTSIGIWAHMGEDVRFCGGRQRRRIRRLWVVFKVLLALLVIGVEIATLMFTWATQNAAQNWRSFFAWFDASVALSSSVKQCDTLQFQYCSASRSVYVVTGLLGTAMSFNPNRTRWRSLIGTMVFIIVASGIFVLAFFFKLYRSYCERRRASAKTFGKSAISAAVVLLVGEDGIPTVCAPGVLKTLIEYEGGLYQEDRQS